MINVLTAIVIVLFVLIEAYCGMWLDRLCSGEVGRAFRGSQREVQNSGIQGYE